MLRTCPLTEGPCTRKLEYNPKTGFLMMPYKEDQLIDVEDRIKGFFEEKGYKITVARDEPKLISLFCKICGQIQCCGFGICVLSDPRPNVFFELGLCFGLGKQVIILGKEGLKLPSDISNIEYYTFKTLRDLNIQLEKIESKLLVGKKSDQDPMEMIILRKAIQLLSDLLGKEGISHDVVESDDHKRMETSKAIKVDNLINFIESKIQSVANPSSYYVLTGNYFFNIYDYEKALSCYQKALENDPDNNDALVSIGKVYYYLGNLDKASEYYERAIEIDDSFPFPYNNLGIIFEDRGEYDRAIDHYNTAISLDPEYPNPYNNIGSIYTLRGEYENACTWYLRALEIDSNFCIARLNFIENCILMNKFSESKQEINILLKNKRISTENRYLTYFFSVLVSLKEQNIEKIRTNIENFVRCYKKYGNIKTEWLFDDIQPVIENLDRKEKELMYEFMSILLGKNDFESFERLIEPFTI